jgi:uncharacterized protein (TIGR02271 family)
MQHTLVAVFDDRSDAQKTMDELLASGFARPDVRLSEGDPTGHASEADTVIDRREDESFGDSIRHFFSDIFGADRGEPAQMYSEAVARGHYVLTLTAEEESEVERAADIVERFGPIDIEEKHQQWRAGELQHSGAGAQQQSASASQQFAPGAGNVQGSVQGETEGARAIPVVQEELKVGKREVQRGGVRIYQRVLETPVSESVDLRDEKVTVHRRAVDQMVDPAEVPAFQETSFELRETAEEPVVEKTARVVEEVIVGKEVRQHQEQVTDTLRRTEVEIEELGAENDQAWRSHWTSNYAAAGGSYDDYAPAYRYGSEMRRSELYRNRPWDEAESDLRQDWEATRPGSTWEKFKAAVRHGWDRITS